MCLFSLSGKEGLNKKPLPVCTGKGLRLFLDRCWHILVACQLLMVLRSSTATVFTLQNHLKCYYARTDPTHGGLDASELKRIKELESENSKLKRMYANLAMENEAIKELLEKKLWLRPKQGNRSDI